MMKTKKGKKDALIEAGKGIMLRKGYHGTGVKEIVDAAGVPKGSFYNYFKSKEDFVLSAMEYAGRQDAQQLAHGPDPCAAVPRSHSRIRSMGRALRSDLGGTDSPAPVRRP